MPAASARKMGTWKLAYADFLTALCAFFLIMWIIHGVSAGERETLAQQFGARPAATLAAAQTAPVETARQLAAELRASPVFKSYESSVTITADANLVRIDLSDMTERPLFETGNGSLNATGQRLTRLTGQAIAMLALPIRIEGHTDSRPSLRPGYSNWELSSDRANSARRLLIESGVSSERIQGVSGLADTQPLLQFAPEDGVNRRISIVLVMDQKTT